MLALFLSLALAACPQMYGVKNADGSWNFAEGAAQSGMIPVEVDENCKAHGEDLELKGGKYKVTASLKKARLDAEKAQDDLIEAKKQRLKALTGKPKLTDDEKDEAIKMLLESR